MSQVSSFKMKGYCPKHNLEYEAFDDPICPTCRAERLARIQSGLEKVQVKLIGLTEAS